MARPPARKSGASRSATIAGFGGYAERGEAEEEEGDDVVDEHEEAASGPGRSMSLSVSLMIPSQAHQ
eukprot:982361-Pyramimonas_sp.AAC.1